jgi:hypothetical protein
MPLILAVYEKKLKDALEDPDLEQSIKEANVELSVRKESVILWCHFFGNILTYIISLQAKWKPVWSQPDLRKTAACRQSEESMHCLRPALKRSRTGGI